MTYIDLTNPLGSCICPTVNRVLLIDYDTEAIYTGTYPFDVVNGSGSALHHATSKTDLFSYWNTANPTQTIYSYVPDPFNILSSRITTILVKGSGSIPTSREFSDEHSTEFA